MKIFMYALRDYDEKELFLKIADELGFEYGYTDAYPTMENASLAEGCDGISIISNPMPPALLDRFYSLGVRCVSTRSIGFDHIDVEYAKKIGMGVCHVTYSADSVANYTIMMMLMACRNVQYILKKAQMQDFSLKGKIGKELSRCTVGIVGTGKIGETVIRHLSAFGCRMLAYDLYPKESLNGLAEYVTLETLYAESDIISLHVPGTRENYHMISAGTLEQMKDGVILINAARGMLIDTSALMDGLETGKVGFAALDTFEQETSGLYYLNRECDILQNRERAILSSFPNVILSPHMAFYTEEAVRDMVRNSVLGIMLYMNGEKNPFAV